MHLKTLHVVNLLLQDLSVCVRECAELESEQFNVPVLWGQVRADQLIQTL